MMSRDMNVNVQMTDRQVFNNKIHLVNFINYLFRTDIKQKYTNGITDHCLFSFRIDDELKSIPFTGPEERLQMRDIAERIALGVGVDKLVNEIFYLEILNEEGQDISFDLTVREIYEVVSAVIVEKENEGEFLFHVTHVDQGDIHIHSVLVD